MKKFLLKTLLFLLPAIGVLAAAEAYVRSLPNTYKYKDDWMHRHGHRLHTIVMGNSHAYYGLMPSAMGDSVFNLANVSQRLEHDYFLLKRYADCCPHLRRVLLVADNSNLFDPPMETDEPARAAYYQLYMGYDAHSPLSAYGFELAHMSYVWQKVGAHSRGGDHWCDSLGWGSGYALAERNAADFLPPNIREHRFVDWPTTHRNLAHLDSIARWCQRRGLSLVILQTPVSAAYTRKASPWQLAKVREMTDSCARSYGARVADFSCDPRFTDLDFFDSDHLNDQGARKFSAILGDSLRALAGW